MWDSEPAGTYSACPDMLQELQKNMSEMFTCVMSFLVLFLIQCIALVLTCTCPYLRTNVLTNIIVVFVGFFNLVYAELNVIEIINWE
jgi:uncharacterized membrane protein